MNIENIPEKKVETELEEDLSINLVMGNGCIFETKIHKDKKGFFFRITNDFLNQIYRQYKDKNENEDNNKNTSHFLGYLTETKMPIMLIIQDVFLESEEKKTNRIYIQEDRKVSVRLRQELNPN